MLKLDFRIVPSEELDAADLFGGRYCSVGEAIACQVKVRRAILGVMTPYQTAWISDDQAAVGKEVRVGNVSVRMWREDGVF